MIWGSASADMANEFFAGLSAAEKFMCEERNRKMIGKIAIFVLCLVYFGAGFGSGGLGAAEGDRAGYRAQTSDGPARTGQRTPEAASPLPQGKTRAEPAKDEKPVAPSKSEPLKPFEPTEKVKADQALDFPADI
jgi:hypothetical protein